MYLIVIQMKIQVHGFDLNNTGKAIHVQSPKIKYCLGNYLSPVMAPLCQTTLALLSLYSVGLQLKQFHVNRQFQLISVVFLTLL